MIVLETDRLILCRLCLKDAAFILELLNDSSYLRFIGDKGVRTLDDARGYLLTGPMESYKRNGFGLYLTQLKPDRVSVGICGLVKREFLEVPDVGYAFLPEFRKKGFAFESASAVLTYGRSALGLNRIVAVTTPDNYASIRVLEKLGLRFEKTVRFPDDDTECRVFS